MNYGIRRVWHCQLQRRWDEPAYIVEMLQSVHGVADGLTICIRLGAAMHPSPSVSWVQWQAEMIDLIVAQHEVNAAVDHAFKRASLISKSEGDELFQDSLSVEVGKKASRQGMSFLMTHLISRMSVETIVTTTSFSAVRLPHLHARSSVCVCVHARKRARGPAASHSGAHMRTLHSSLV